MTPTPQSWTAEVILIRKIVRCIDQVRLNLRLSHAISLFWSNLEECQVKYSPKIGSTSVTPPREGGLYKATPPLPKPVSTMRILLVGLCWTLLGGGALRFCDAAGWFFPDYQPIVEFGVWNKNDLICYQKRILAGTQSPQVVDFRNVGTKQIMVHSFDGSCLYDSLWGPASTTFGSSPPRTSGLDFALRKFGEHWRPRTFSWRFTRRRLWARFWMTSTSRSGAHPPWRGCRSRRCCRCCEGRLEFWLRETRPNCQTRSLEMLWGMVRWGFTILHVSMIVHWRKRKNKTGKIFWVCFCFSVTFYYH